LAIDSDVDVDVDVAAAVFSLTLLLKLFTLRSHARLARIVSANLPVNQVEEPRFNVGLSTKGKVVKAPQCFSLCNVALMLPTFILLRLSRSLLLLQWRVSRGRRPMCGAHPDRRQRAYSSELYGKYEKLSLSSFLLTRTDWMEFKEGESVTIEKRARCLFLSFGWSDFKFSALDEHFCLACGYETNREKREKSMNVSATLQYIRIFAIFS